MNAPVIVFAYNRPKHLDIALTALANNDRVQNTDLYIFVDGPKDENGRSIHQDVIAVCGSHCSAGFKNYTVIDSASNKGLSVSIIGGVSQIMNEYGRAIVIEDDAVSSPEYLSFMNDALDFYESDPSVWSIGGFTVPLKIPNEYAYDIIKTQRVSSYAWATWKDRWEKIDWDVKDYGKFRWDFKKRKQFNAWGDDRASMLDDQMNGRVNSWAIRFDFSMFQNGMYNIIPSHSLVKNIGHDGSGTHSIVDNGLNDPFRVELSNKLQSFQFRTVSVDKALQDEFCQFFSCGKISKAKRFISNLVFSKLEGLK